MISGIKVSDLFEKTCFAGCMAALDAEHYLQELGAQEGKSDW